MNHTCMHCTGAAVAPPNLSSTTLVRYENLNSSHELSKYYSKVSSIIPLYAFFHFLLATTCTEES